VLENLGLWVAEIGRVRLRFDSSPKGGDSLFEKVFPNQTNLIEDEFDHSTMASWLNQKTCTIKLP